MAISQIAVCSSGFLGLLRVCARTSSAVLWSKGCKDHLALTACGNTLLPADHLSHLLLCFVHTLLTLSLGANSEQVSGSSALLGLCAGGLAAWAGRKQLSAPFGLQLLFTEFGSYFVCELVLEHS